FIEANSIAGQSEGATANARQAEDVPGPSQGNSPHITSLILDQANNQVQFIFSEAVTSGAAEATTAAPPGCEPPVCVTDDAAAIGVEIYDINGATFPTVNVVEGSANTLIATFGAGIVTGLIQGGSSDAGVAIAAANTDRKSGVDEFGRQNTFQQGRTAAPDLISISRTPDDSGNLRIAFTFDQSAVTTTGNPIGQFVLYQQDNTRRSISRDSCVTEGVETVCTLIADTPDFLAAQTARYATVEYAAVNAGGGAKFNPEGGFAFN
ncbi:MAG: hypothetical protein ACI867_002044, partial [Glaciecola sp.]